MSKCNRHSLAWDWRAMGLFFRGRNARSKCPTNRRVTFTNYSLLDLSLRVLLFNSIAHHIATLCGFEKGGNYFLVPIITSTSTSIVTVESLFSKKGENYRTVSIGLLTALAESQSSYEWEFHLSY